MKTLLTAVIGLAALMITPSIRAAEIKVIASNGVKEALHELAPAFERETGHKLVISFGLATALKRQIEAGEAFDLAILPAAVIDDLAKQGKVDAGARAPIARSGVGIGIKKGAPLCRVIPVRRDTYFAAEMSPETFDTFFARSQKWLATHGKFEHEQADAPGHVDITRTYVRQQVKSKFVVMT